MCPSIKEIYALFKMLFKKICNIHVQNEGGGVKGRLNNVKKLHYWYRMASLSPSRKINLPRKVGNFAIRQLKLSQS